MMTLYNLSDLQPFVFGMRYLQSATKCALSKSCASLDCIYYVTIIVATVYTTALIGTLIVICLTFPGWETYFGDLNEYINWVDNVYIPCEKARVCLWVVLSLVSAGITVYSVYKMIKIIKQLGSDYNKPKLIVHAILVVF
jgi:hypothetical protein